MTPPQGERGCAGLSVSTCAQPIFAHLGSDDVGLHRGEYRHDEPPPGQPARCGSSLGQRRLLRQEWRKVGEFDE